MSQPLSKRFFRGLNLAKKELLSAPMQCNGTPNLRLGACPFAVCVKRRLGLQLPLSRGRAGVRIDLPVRKRPGKVIPPPGF
jgi:hypothetical protein